MKLYGIWLALYRNRQNSYSYSLLVHLVLVSSQSNEGILRNYWSVMVVALFKAEHRGAGHSHLRKAHGKQLLLYTKDSELSRPPTQHGAVTRGWNVSLYIIQDTPPFLPIYGYLSFFCRFYTGYLSIIS